MRRALLTLLALLALCMAGRLTAQDLGAWMGQGAATCWNQTEANDGACPGGKCGHGQLNLAVTLDPANPAAADGRYGVGASTNKGSCNGGEAVGGLPELFAKLGFNCGGKFPCPTYEDINDARMLRDFPARQAVVMGSGSGGSPSPCPAGQSCRPPPTVFICPPPLTCPPAPACPAGLSCMATAPPPCPSGQACLPVAPPACPAGMSCLAPCPSCAACPDCPKAPPPVCLPAEVLAAAVAATPMFPTRTRYQYRHAVLPFLAGLPACEGAP
jgi:hypothetical protein